jgi:hypothetical protein
MAAERRRLGGRPGGGVSRSQSLKVSKTPPTRVFL